MAHCDGGFLRDGFRGCPRGRRRGRSRRAVTNRRGRWPGGDRGGDRQPSRPRAVGTVAQRDRARRAGHSRDGRVHSGPRAPAAAAEHQPHERDLRFPAERRKQQDGCCDREPAGAGQRIHLDSGRWSTGGVQRHLGRRDRHLDDSAVHGRAHRGSARRRLRGVRFGRGGRRGEHHHPQGLRGRRSGCGLRPSPQERIRRNPRQCRGRLRLGRRTCQGGFRALPGQRVGFVPARVDHPPEPFEFAYDQAEEYRCGATGSGVDVVLRRILHPANGDPLGTGRQSTYQCRVPGVERGRPGSRDVSQRPDAAVGFPPHRRPEQHRRVR